MSNSKRTISRTAVDEARLKFELQRLEAAGERFLSPTDIAGLMHVTKEAVQQWIYRRKLPATKQTGEQWKVRVADFEAFLRAREALGRKSVLITDGPGHGSADLIEISGELGLLTIVAHNYADALLKALDCVPALFVINIDSECWKFAERVRSHKPLRTAPILFICGSGISDDDSDRAISFRAKGILTRPLAKSVVKEEIARILTRNQ